MMENRLPRHQISLRDFLILFLFISFVIGITSTRLSAYRDLHGEIRLELHNAYELEVAALLNGDTGAEQITHVRHGIANLERQTAKHLAMTFFLLGVGTAVFALALSIPRIRSWMTRD